MISKKMNGFIGILAYLFTFFFVGALIQFIVTKVCAVSSGLTFEQIIGTKDQIFVEGTIVHKMHYLSQAVSNLLIYFVLFVFLIIIFRNDLKEEFIKIKSKKYKFIIYSLVGGLVLYLSSTLISYIYTLNNIGSSENQEIIVNMVKISPTLVFFSVVVFAPLCEELIFRKSIYDVCENKVLYYILSTLVFGLIHMTTTLNVSLSTWFLMLIPYVLSGLILSVCYERTDNIYASIICHIINNLIAYIILFM